ncbi:MAG: hypothetical protein J6D31_09215 [Clostridia bacterium]|nr:hypothetical protein [Clostridia bacterium]
MMKQRYIDLMEKALSAYTDEHILRYFNDVKTNGLTEHGFPRLTANIGILIAHGKRRDLLPLFMEMMEVCCDMFLRPYVQAGNEFSVREIVCCIKELEDAEAVEAKDILRWKQKISQIVPEACYNVVVKRETDRMTNWAIFGAVSEYARFYFGLGENHDFINRQLSCQLQWLDENGMYRDNLQTLVHQPIMYDYASRGLFAMLLHFGYRGKYYEQLDSCLKRSGLLTLKMQSPNGEIPFGGRSNQFLHNEPWMMLLFEYEARRYVKEGNIELAKTFKAAIARALDATEAWLNKQPIRHIKNSFPTETSYGCEEYAYFDKYMITTASNLYAAYLLCDDSIPTIIAPDHEPAVLQTSYHFHKLFLKSGGYALEFDTNADPRYDASGLGRVHREGAPSTICLSCPCPADPVYTLNVKQPFAFSLCAAIRKKDEWCFGADEGTKYEVWDSGIDKDRASTTILCQFAEGRMIKEHYTVNENGVHITLEGDGEIGYTLPALCFDGATSPEITAEEHSLTVSYEGWICRYTTNGRICDLNRIAANRNGHYRVFVASAQSALHVTIEIFRSVREGSC